MRLKSPLNFCKEIREKFVQANLVTLLVTKPWIVLLINLLTITRLQNVDVTHKNDCMSFQLIGSSKVTHLWANSTYVQIWPK